MVAVRPRAALSLGARRRSGSRRLGDPRRTATVGDLGRAERHRSTCRAPIWLPATGSVLLNLAANFAYFRSLQLSPLSQTLPMLSFTPAFAAVLAAVFLGERLGLRAVAGLFLVVAGALLLTLRTGTGLRGFFAGLFEDRGCRLMVEVAFLWSASLLLDKKALAAGTPHLHALVLNGGVALGALAVLSDAARSGQARWPSRQRLASSGRDGHRARSRSASQLVALSSVPVGFIETVKRGVGGILAVVWGRTLLGRTGDGGKAGGGRCHDRGCRHGRALIQSTIAPASIILGLSWPRRLHCGTPVAAP